MNLHIFFYLRFYLEFKVCDNSEVYRAKVVLYPGDCCKIFRNVELLSDQSAAVHTDTDNSLSQDGLLAGLEPSPRPPHLLAPPEPSQ